MQCISNVLTNAAKYTDPRGEIHVEESEREGEAVVTITDNGAGIPQMLLPRIFDLFVQGDRTLDRAQGGLGIGLSIVKRVLEMHQGKIVASRAGAGRGSTFEILLPLMEVSATLPAAAAAAKSPARKILVVDDNADAADSLTMVLGFDGHEVLAVYTGLQALEQAERFKPDIMLIDIGLRTSTVTKSLGESVRLLNFNRYAWWRSRDMGRMRIRISPMRQASRNIW